AGGGIELAPGESADTQIGGTDDGLVDALLVAPLAAGAANADEAGLLKGIEVVVEGLAGAPEALAEFMDGGGTFADGGPEFLPSGGGDGIEGGDAGGGGSLRRMGRGCIRGAHCS